MNDSQKSKFLSFVLRHDPASIGLEMDAYGWVSLQALLRQAPPKMGLSHEDVVRITAESDKKRFALSPDQLQIRAVQGHSHPVDLNLQAQTPPATLYHGTASRFLHSILEQGLLKGERHHVHLSPSVATASQVGSRYGTLVLLAIAAASMHEAGYPFYVSENGVWLTDTVPPHYIQVTQS